MLLRGYPRKGAGMADKEVMQMALDALEQALSDDQPYIVSCKQTVEALRAALAQPESGLELNKVLIGAIWDSSEIVASPQREWQGLTDDEVDEAEKEFGVWRGRVAKQSFESGAWWANEKLLEKNT